jgi:hypothetical protein
MAVADDGGGQISYDGGETWSTYYNQPTAQYYRVNVDNHFPYRIYVAQQDNSTQRVLHRSSGSSIGERHWESTAGCECGHIAIDPTNNDIVYGGCYDGLLERRDHANDQRRSVTVWPDNPMGHGAEGMKYRFQWNFPIFFSPHDPKKLYTASNHLHVSFNEGQSWEIISPDLTRNDPEKLKSSGGPITQDNTSVEYYCTIFAAAESPRVKDLLWAGSDDGLVHVSRDGGENWNNVTPGNLPEWAMINSLEIDPHNDGGCYIAATLYKSGDFRPLIYKTEDYGQTWRKITNGIHEEHFTRVVRADPDREGLLYAGTETGVYISLDDGNNWQSLQLNLPIVPITDLIVKEKNLIASTQGRSIWLLDDLTPFHNWDGNTSGDMRLFQPMDSYSILGSQNKKVKNAGMNHPGGIMTHFYLKEHDEEMDTVKLRYTTRDGILIREFSNKTEEKKDKLKVEQGSNRFVWNMRYPDGKKFEGMIFWWGSLAGAKVVPGSYRVELEVNGKVASESFNILADPRVEMSSSDHKARFDFINEVMSKVTEAHEAIIEIRDVRGQMKNYTVRLPEEDEFNALREMAENIDSVMTSVEEALYQTKNRSSQDPLNFPIRLTNKLAHLNSQMGVGQDPPTDQAVELKNELVGEIDWHLNTYEMQVKGEMIPRFNAMVREKEVDAILLKED